jgi:hypothetical protein
MVDDIKQQTTASQILRGRLDQVRARYDHGAVPPSLYKAIQEMEREIAWTDQKERQS